MANPTYVTGLIDRLMIELDNPDIDADVKAWWIDRLNQTRKGHDWARNPEGYFLKGIAPKSHRAHDFTLKQFAYALKNKLMGNAEKVLRVADDAVIKAGVLWSEARADSQYGSKADRLSGAKIAAVADKATKESLKLAISLHNKARNAPTVALATVGRANAVNAVKLVAPKSISKSKNKAIGE